MNEYEPSYTVQLSDDEVEYLQCALHVWIEKNAGYSTEEILAGYTDDIWAPQHVEASALLDKLIKLVGGRDFAIDGQ